MHALDLIALAQVDLLTVSWDEDEAGGLDATEGVIYFLQLVRQRVDSFSRTVKSVRNGKP